MRVYILTEGGKNIGFGHITRCISIYQAFKEKEIEPKFILNGDKSTKDLVKNLDFQIINWLKNSILDEIKNSDIVIVDSYLTNKEFYELVSQNVKKAVYIDDNKRLDYPKGVVINGNIHATTLNYPKKEDTQYLLGTKYTPLRKEFWDVGQKVINKDIETILITFGGDDGKNMTPKVLDLLKKYKNLKKFVVIGKGFQNIEDIEKIQDENIYLFYNVNAKKIKELMLKADIAISAAGQTLYELVRIGTPTIAIAVADNQLKSVKKLDEAGFVVYAGYYNEKDVLKNTLNFFEKLSDKNLREKMAKIGREIVDGQGSRNIVKKLLKKWKM